MSSSQKDKSRYTVFSQIEEDSLLSWPGPLIIFDHVGYLYKTTSILLKNQGKSICMCCPHDPLDNYDCKLLAESFLKSNQIYVLYIVGNRQSHEKGHRIFCEALTEICEDLWPTKGDFLNGFIGFVDASSSYVDKFKNVCQANCQSYGADSYYE